MTFTIKNRTVAALTVAATVFTSSLAVVGPASAGGPGFKAPPAGPNICMTKPWLCGPGGIKLPPKKPVPPAPAPKPGMSAGTAAAIGIVGGLIVGSAIANANKNKQAAGNAQAHYNYCFAKFRTYRIEDNSYMSYSGVRKPCISPYI